MLNFICMFVFFKVVHFNKREKDDQIVLVLPLLRNSWRCNTEQCKFQTKPLTF